MKNKNKKIKKKKVGVGIWTEDKRKKIKDKETKGKVKKLTIKQKLEILAKQINPNENTDVCHLISRSPKIERCPTGIFWLDFHSNGGIPRGQMTLIYGLKGSAKSTIAYKIIATLQKRCRRCGQEKIRCNCKNFEETSAGIISFESKLDREWLKAIGVDNDRCLEVNPITAEEAIDITEKFILSRDLDIIVVDSLASLTPEDEVELSSADWRQGLQARLINKGMRTFQSALNACRRKGFFPTVIFINQIRYKIGVPVFINPEVIPGGVGQGFAIALEIRLQECGQSKHVFDESFKIPIYKRFAYKITKNNLGPDGSSGEFNLMEGDTEFKKKGEFADELELITLAVKYGIIIEEEGTLIWEKQVFGKDKDEKEGQVKRRRERMKRFFQQDKEAYSKLYNQLLEKMWELSKNLRPASKKKE